VRVNHVARMKYSVISLAALLLFTAVPAAAAVPDSAALATISGVVAATNADDAARVGSYFAPDAVVVDENTPFVWRGAQAGADWWRSVQALVRNNKLRAAAGSLIEYRQDDRAGNAYAVVPLTITVQSKGKAMTERGLWALTLHRSGSDWKITTASWATLRR
jgi:ketosteroid isomerase-like protein